VLVILFGLLIAFAFIQTLTPKTPPIPAKDIKDLDGAMEVNNMIGEILEQEIDIPIEVPFIEPPIILTPTCTEQNGYICKENETCEGNNLVSVDTTACCDIVCTLTIPLDTENPIVTITSHQSREQIFTYFTTIKATITDNIGITKVDLLIDGVIIQTITNSPYEFEWDTRDYSKGNHSVIIKAYDEAGNVGKDGVTLNLR
jgi:hypothetical protein